MPMMYNPQLETFLCVVDSGSFGSGSHQTDQFSGEQSGIAVV